MKEETMSLTAKERIEIVAANLLEIKLDSYEAHYLINNCANDLINASSLFLKEYYASEESN
jgi:hypothetical protein